MKYSEWVQENAKSGRNVCAAHDGTAKCSACLVHFPEREASQPCYVPPHEHEALDVKYDPCAKDLKIEGGAILQDAKMVFADSQGTEGEAPAACKLIDPECEDCTVPKECCQYCGYRGVVIVERDKAIARAEKAEARVEELEKERGGWTMKVCPAVVQNLNARVVERTKELARAIKDSDKAEARVKTLEAWSETCAKRIGELKAERNEARLDVVGLNVFNTATERLFPGRIGENIYKSIMRMVERAEALVRIVKEENARLQNKIVGWNPNIEKARKIANLRVRIAELEDQLTKAHEAALEREQDPAEGHNAQWASSVNLSCYIVATGQLRAAQAELCAAEQEAEIQRRSIGAAATRARKLTAAASQALGLIGSYVYVIGPSDNVDTEVAHAVNEAADVLRKALCQKEPAL